MKTDVLPEGSAKVRIVSVTYEASIPTPAPEDLRARIEQILASSSWMVDRTNGRTAIDVRPLLIELAYSEGALKMQLRIDSRGGVGPRDVLATLGLEDIELRGSRLQRTVVEISS